MSLYIYIYIYANIFVILVCSGIYMLSNISSSRYLFNMVTSLLLLSAYYINNYNNKYLKTISFILVLITGIYFAREALSTYPKSLYNKQIIGEVVDMLEERDLNYGYTVNPLYNKQIDTYTNEGIYTSLAGWNENENKFFVVNTRVYSEDLKKPDNVDRFFILCEEMNNPIFLEHCKEVILFYNNMNLGLGIYVFDIENWDDVMTEG